MTSIEKLSLDLTLIRSIYRTGDFTPEEVIREIYRRIRANGEEEIWLWLRPEEESAALARERGDRLDLPMAAIPFAVSDNIHAAGIPTTAGCAEYRHVPTESAKVVTLIEAAGGILIGKTVMEPFGVGLCGANAPGGPRRSVFHKPCVSGGPSSGAALAVAKSLVSFALGTDTTGAGQIVAAFNHLVAVKPTQGIVSLQGVIPGCQSLDAATIFTNCVSDAAAILDTIVAEDPGYAWSRPSQTPMRFARPIRYGVPRNGQLDFHGDRDSEIVYLRALERLEGLGCQRVEVDLTPFLEAAELADSDVWAAERFAAIGKFIESAPDAVAPAVSDKILKGRSISGVDVFEVNHRLEALRKASAESWTQMDLLVLPTAPTIATPKEALENPGQTQAKLGACTAFINVFDLAAVSIPVGYREDGISFGLSLIVPAFCDWELCRLAKLVSGEALSIKTQTPPQHAVQSDILFAVTGTHMSGGTMNQALTSRRATFREAVETAPDYALYVLDTTPPKPGLINVGPMMGVAIEAELWSLSPEAFASLVSETPPPICVGNVRLKDGRVVKGFLCEEHATRKAAPISAFGGWRGYLESVELIGT